MTTLLILLSLFLLTTMLSFLVISKLSRNKIDKRLQMIKKQVIAQNIVSNKETPTWQKAVLDTLVKLSMPEGNWESSAMRMNFLRAGYRGESPILFYFAAKTLLSLIFLISAIIFCFYSDQEFSFFYAVSLVIVFTAIGYYLPSIYLKIKTKHRQEEIFESFPDALDLMRICVSSGLGLDAAISRVGRELSITSKALAQEFHQLSLELRAGATRENALKNLANRTGVDDIKALVAMLIQSERFGTSVTDSLKIHADGLRSKRKLKAQETAAKIPAKLSIPMILCIFPAIFVVILGPAILSIVHMLTPLINSHYR